MTYNPIGLPQGKYIWDMYPIFSRRPIFHNPFSEFPELPLSLDEWHDVLRYIILFVDNESPYAYERDFDVRSNVCLDAIQPCTDLTIAFIQEKGVEFNKSLFQFFKIVNDHKYKLWWSKINSIREDYEYLSAGVKSESSTEKRLQVKALVEKSISERTTELIKIESELFNDSRMKRIVEEESEESELSGYAEKYAKTIDF